MKTSLIALATVLGLSGAAFADNADKAPSNTAQTEILIKKSSHDIQAPASGEYASEAGIDVNPNFLPHF